MERTERRLQRELRQLRRSAAHVRFGTVTDTSPLSITLGAAAEVYADVKRVDGTALAVDDRVAVLKWGSDLIVLGPVA
jgi:hypothetical protein